MVLSSLLWRGVPLAIAWVSLTEGDARSWVVGVPAVLAAMGLSMRVSPPQRVRIRVDGVAAFIPYFVWRSMWGSLDVAWRAMHPRLPIAPSLERYALRLPSGGPARVFFADMVNLLPGTLTARLDDDAVTIHLLNGASPTALAELRRLEARVAALFGVSLQAQQALERP